VSCGECLKDEDETTCWYHPDCFKIKHSKPMSESKIQRHEAVSREIASKVLLEISPTQLMVFVEKGSDVADKVTGGLNSLATRYITMAGGGVMRSGAKVLQMSGLAHLAIATVEVGVLAVKWYKGGIDSKAFATGAIKAAVANLASFATCATLGAVLGSVIPVVGTVIGGILAPSLEQ